MIAHAAMKIKNGYMILYDNVERYIVPKTTDLISIYNIVNSMTILSLPYDGHHI